VRIDPGNQPGLWLFTQITLHDLDDQGVVIQPAVLNCDARNGLMGLTPIQGCMLLPVTGTGRYATGKVLSWDNDPQMLLRLPDNRHRRSRILTLSCAALDPAHAIMAGHGQQLFDEIANLANQLKSLQAATAPAR
jgi:hypothetical protein